MRLPEAQAAALSTVHFASPWDIKVEKWTQPTHLYGYRVDTIILTRRDGTEVGRFDGDTPHGLLVLAAYERLVLAYYDDCPDTSLYEVMFNEAVHAGLKRLDTSDRVLVLTGNVVDGLTMTGPFKDSDEGLNWVNDNRVEDYVLAPLKHPEA